MLKCCQMRMQTLEPRRWRPAAAKIMASDVNVYYGEKQALKNVSLDIPDARSRPSSARRAAASRPSCAASTA